ncbi:hypothetical protein P7K49_006755, partial [Saguinus oedipus]
MRDRALHLQTHEEKRPLHPSRFAPPPSPPRGVMGRRRHSWDAVVQADPPESHLARAARSSSSSDLAIHLPERGKIEPLNRPFPSPSSPGAKAE